MRFEVTIVVATVDDQDLIDNYGDDDTYKEDKEMALGDAVEAILQDTDLDYCTIVRVGVPSELKD